MYEGSDVGPGQLCTQCVHNLLVLEDRSDAYAIVKLSFAPARAVIGTKASGQSGNYFFAVFSAAPLHNFNIQPAADLPVEQGQFRVDGAFDGPSDEILASSFIQYAFHGSNTW